MTIIVGCGHFYVAVYKLFMWSTILGRAPGARNWSHPHPWTICLCQIPSAWVCQEQHIENIYQDCSSSGLWADCIAKYNIVLQSIEKYCKGLLWTMGEARHIESQWNEMHSNPSSLPLCTWYCSPSEWKVASRLFLADTICQLRIQLKLNTALLSHCPSVCSSVCPSQAWHLTFLTYIKA